MRRRKLSSPNRELAEVIQTPVAQGHEWLRTEFGARWPIWLGLGVVLLFTLGAVAPLADPDLPMHLATGRWIAHHHAVPHAESFAWTRQGAPYYAYSWMPEITYYFLYTHWGPDALRMLHGLTQVSTGIALVWLACVSGWKSWTALILIFLTSVMSVVIMGFLRPQAILVPLILLAWVCGLRLLDSERPMRWAIGLAGVAVAAANTHLLFPLTGLPLALALARTPVPWRRAGLMAAVLVAGWLTAPYGLEWSKVFALNFGHNSLFDYPSVIVEFTPGFRFAARYPLWMLLAAMLALTPWALRDSDATPRERLVLGGIWFVGLAGFAMALRTIVVWWFATLPMLALVLERLPRPRTHRHQRVLLLAMAALPVVITVKFARTDAALGRDIVPPARASVDALASWLDNNVRLTVGQRPRVLTNFDYGSYLTWRLPRYSMSMDGRTIFPDSVAQAEAYRFADQGAIPLGPWRSADLAIVPLRVPVAAVLDTAHGWVRLDTVAIGPRVPLAVGLWASERWLQATHAADPQ